MRVRIEVRWASDLDRAVSSLVDFYDFITTTGKGSLTTTHLGPLSPDMFPLLLPYSGTCRAWMRHYRSN
jgi:hypothetical protein